MIHTTTHKHNIHGRTLASIIGGLLFTMASIPVQSAHADDRWAFQTGKLDNGLTVITLEDRRVPLISVQVWYHVGSKDENPERQGFAHMFEHMMFRGTDRIGPQDHFRFLSRFGARVNGYTSFDQTVYWETLPSSQLELALWLEAERMGHLKINDDYFAAEREVVKEERRKNYLNRPYGKLYESLYAAAYKEHPYRWTPIGNMEHLDAATTDELREFFHTYYVPNNATLVLVGDIDHATAMKKAEQFFGSIPRRPDPQRVTIQEPPMTVPRHVELTDIAPSPLVLLAYHSPSDVSADSIAMEILSQIVGTGQSSRLYRHLVQGASIAVSASGYNAAREQSGLFVMSAVLKPDVDVETGLKALRAEVQDIVDNGITEAELEKARNQVLAEYVRLAETVQGRADQLGYAAVILGDPNRVNTDRQYLRTLTVDQVMAVARHVLRDDNKISLVIRPETAKSPEAQEAATDQSKKTEEKIVDRPPPADMPRGRTPQPVVLPEPIVKTLDNGLRVAVFSESANPSVNVSFAWLCGGKNDRSDLAGLAYCTFNTLRRGTAEHTGDELAEMLDSRAIQFSANVDQEDAGVSLWTLREHLDKSVELLAQIVQTPTFPEQEVANFLSRAAAQQAINEKDPGTIVSRRFAIELFGDHYMSRPTEGTSASLKSITRDEIVDFHKRYLVPRGATLVFAGDIKPEAAFALAQQRFGSWKEAGTAESPKVAALPAAKPLRIVLVDRPDASQSEIRIGQLVSLTRKDDDYAQARLLSQLFGESFSGRLNKSIRIEKGLTYGVRGSFDVNVDTASFRMNTFTRTERTAEAVKAMIEDVRRLKTDPVTQDELSTARDTLIGQFQMGLETPGQIADRWWNLTVWGLPQTWYTDYQKQLASTSDPAALTTAIERIRPDRFIIVVVGKASEIKDNLAKIGPVTVQSAE
ncbi:MAG: insulinase family protein [Phycisphaerae bacterium]|nr:insulinase family protein [Phycisphaerae bacterium]